MKKILFCASLLALATSCTQDETISLDVQNGKAKGITFELVESVDSRILYDQVDGKWSPMWFAEKDRIAIWANGVHNYAEQSGDTIDGASWMTLADVDSVVYKATSSSKTAKWTGINDNNTIEFVKGDKKGAKFLAVYNPGGAPVLSAESATDPDKADTLYIQGILPTTNAQTVTSTMGENEAIAMIAYNEASQENVWESVGEKVDLKFKYATPILKLGTVGLTEEYQKAFGKLKQVVVSTHGKKGVKPSPLFYNANAQVALDTINFNPAVVAIDELNAIADSLAADTLNVIIGNGGLAWNDKAVAPVAVATRATKGEAMKATYMFENIDITVSKDSVTVDFTPSASFYAINLKMADYDYLVTNESTAGAKDRTLFVNKGSFDGILTKDTLGIDWAAATNGKVAFTEIAKVVVAKEVVLDADDFHWLNKMINVTDLTLNGNTTIPANAMKAMTELHTIDLPLVTSVGVDAFGADSLVTVIMPAYKFNEAANSDLLQKTKLVTLEMGAEAMNAGFPKTGLNLTDFTALKKVTVKDDIELGPNAFAGCTNLTEIVGRVNITGTDVFKGCEVLDKVVVKSTEIPAGAFDGCAEMDTVYYNAKGTMLVPTIVGNRAFAGTAVNIDLSKTTAIGDEAFAGNEALAGYKYSDVNPEIVVMVGATEIGNSAFADTKIKLIEFTGATKIGNKVFFGNSDLEEIKFVKAFTYAYDGVNKKPHEYAFGNNADETKLFVNKEQTGLQLDNKSIKFGYDITKDGEYYQFEFLTVVKNAQ